MKKVVLSALLLAAVAVSASAEIYPVNGVNYSGPNRGQAYSCTYTNYSGPAVDGADGGSSSWTLAVSALGGKPLLRGTEHFQATDPYGQTFQEGYKATWAKPVNDTDPVSQQPYTWWEYTFNPYGPQCKRVGVYFNAFKLTFKECSDGHSRTCWLVY